MMLLSMVFPRLFLSIGPALGIALLVSILAELVLMLVGGVVYGVFDFVVAAIFCGYIGYDWAVAQRRQFTTDNAIDSACALYLDIVNLFIRLLAIFGKRRRS
jgi:FtsH-binding integral membrane protein